MRSLLVTFAAVLVSSVLAGCSGGDRPMASDNSNDVGEVSTTHEDSDAGAPSDSTLCDTDRVGCPCYNEGASFDCGRVHRHSGTYESCADGNSTCTNGVWGACEGPRMIGSN
ncbi:MAG: hypothetical protein ACRELY_11825 [Polyangiaceae bacterium]